MSVINVEFLGRTFEVATKAEDGGIKLNAFDVFRLERAEDYPTFLTFLPRVGSAAIYKPVFFIESARASPITDDGAESDGGLTVRVDYVLTTGTFRTEQEQEQGTGAGTFRIARGTDVEGNVINSETPPWLYRIADWNVSSSTEETSVAKVWNVGASTSVAFCNSAGVPLQATTTRTLTATSFSYNVQTFDINTFGAYNGRVNASAITIGGIAFPARTVKIVGLNATEQVVYENESATATGEDGETYPTGEPRVKWRYVKIDVRLLRDPATWNRDFLNVGTHIRTSGGLAKLWSWKTSSGVVYGTYSDALAQTSAEEVVEPLFLNAAGTDVSPIGADGKQTPVYLTGCVDEPKDFGPLGLPAVR